MNGTQALDGFLQNFKTLEPVWTKGSQAWLQPVRRAAIGRLEELGFPTTHDEDWRFTNLAPLVKTAFRPAEDVAPGVDARSLEPFTFADCDCSRLVFVNGRFALGLSMLSPLPAGVRAGSLAQILAGDRGTLEPHLARHEDFQHEAFSALNTAFLTDGAFVSVPRGVLVEKPIHLLYRHGGRRGAGGHAPADPGGDRGGEPGVRGGGLRLAGRGRPSLQRGHRGRGGRRKHRRATI